MANCQFCFIFIFIYLFASDHVWVHNTINNPNTQQETHHEMGIPERDVYRLICLLAYAYPRISIEPEPVSLTYLNFTVDI